MRKLAILLICFATTGQADAWVLRENDRIIAQSDLDLRLRGQTLMFYDNGQAEYYDDGRYTYTYANDGGIGYGYFKVTADSTICIEFVNGFSRCDGYVLDTQDRLVVITEKGERFPARR